MQFKTHMPVEIVFGAGTVRGAGDVAARFGKRAFVVTMKELAKIGLVDAALESLRCAGVDYVFFDECKAEPKSADIDATAEILRESGCDMVIGLGGGSCIDMAKALAICARHPEPVWEYVNLSNRPPQSVNEDNVLPVIAAPTTAGTGSEVTPYAIVTNSETVQKGTIKESAIFARVAIVDPELSVSLSPRLTAATGVDALAHAFESYLNVKNRTPYSDMIAEEALRQIVRWLPVAYGDGCDMDARTGMSWGSMLGGIAISQAGTTVVHAMAQPLGARLGLPHSDSVAILLPAVLRHTLPAAEERFAWLWQVLSDSDASPLDIPAAARASIDALEVFLDSIGMHVGLASLDVPDGLDESIADDVTSYMSRPLGQHPKPFSRDEIQQIVRDSM